MEPQERKTGPGTKDFSHYGVSIWDKKQDQTGNVFTSTDLVMMTGRKSLSLLIQGSKP